MNVYIKNVENRIKDPEENNIISFNIIGLLKNGIEIKIIDDIPFDLRDFQNTEVKCLLLANLFESIESKPVLTEDYHPILEGKLLGEYKIPNRWLVAKQYQLIEGWDEYVYNAIQIDSGILLVKPHVLESYKVKVGETFKFKIIDFELMAWAEIKGENQIDPLAYEKSLIEKFWNLMEATREDCNQNGDQQLELIRKELLNWTYNEIWLFDNILKSLSIDLEFNENLENIFRPIINHWPGDFCLGIVALGKEAYNEAYFTPSKFYQNIKEGQYVKRPEDLENKLYVLVGEVIEEKSGKTFDEIADYEIREDIDDLTDKIYDLLKKQLEMK